MEKHNVGNKYTRTEKRKFENNSGRIGKLR